MSPHVDTLGGLFEALDAVDFASLEDAYGPAAGVPGLLVDCAGERALAEGALGELEAGIFHQGSYYSASAPAAGWLAALAGEAVPARAPIMLFLAAMSGGHQGLGTAWDPYAWCSTPDAPGYPEAVETIEAIRARAGGFESALGGSPEERSAAAFLLAGLGAKGALPALEASLVETEHALVRASLALASRALGGSPGVRPPPSLEGDLFLALDALEGTLREGTFEALERLALASRADGALLPWWGGDVSSLAVSALEAAARTQREAACSVLWRALEARLSRGERVLGPRAPHQDLVGDDDAAERVPEDRGEYGLDAPLRSLAGALARLTVPPPPSVGTLVRREQLDADARRTLELTVRHAIPLPALGVPWITPEAMARFLRGGGALDRVVAVGAVTAPVYEHLHALLDRRAQAGDPEYLALAGALDDEGLFEVIVDGLDGAYPALGGAPLPWALVTRLVPLVSARLLGQRARFERYREALSTREARGREQAFFALLPELTERALVEPRYDPLVLSALAVAPARDGAWLRAFPEPRRSRLVARAGNPWLHGALAKECEPEALAEALVEAFLAPGCHWTVYDATQLLLGLRDAPRLRAALPGSRGRRRAVLERALAELTGEGFFELELRPVEGGLVARLTTASGAHVAERTLPAAPQRRDFEWLQEALGSAARPVIEVVGGLEGAAEYQVVLRLVEAVRAEVRTGGGATRWLQRTTEGGSSDGGQASALFKSDGR